MSSTSTSEMTNSLSSIFSANSLASLVTNSKKVECNESCGEIVFPLFCTSSEKTNSFLPSFIPAISIAPLQVHYYSEALRLQHGYCIRVSRRSAQATAGKGRAQGTYVAARAGVEPTTIRLKVIVSTKAHHVP